MRTYRYALYVPFTILTFALGLIVHPHPLSAAGAADSTRWATEVITRFSVSQIGFQNWSDGGLDVLSIGTGLDGVFTRTSDQWIQKHEVRLRLGVVKQDTLDFRKADDQIQLKSSIQVRGEGFFQRFNPVMAISLHSQFADGYDYKKNPFEDGRKPPVQVSAFAAPATLTHSIGLTYDVDPWFVQRIGVGSKTTLVTEPEFRALHGLDPDQAVRFELGIDATTQVDRELFENVRYKGDLKLFAAFGQPESPPDFLWENVMAMKVNSWLGVTFEFVTLFDRDERSDLQFKENLSVGVVYTLL